jgi:hypothetical protein
VAIRDEIDADDIMNEAVEENIRACTDHAVKEHHAERLALHEPKPKSISIDLGGTYVFCDGFTTNRSYWAWPLATIADCHHK